MMTKTILPFFAFILLLAAILYGGPKLSSFLTDRYKTRINKNAVTLKAVVSTKKTHKGNTVHFRYNFRHKEYENNEQSDDLYNQLEIGDTINVAVDSTEPSSCYIIGQ